MTFFVTVLSLTNVGFHILLLFATNIDQATSTNDYIDSHCGDGTYGVGSMFQENMESLFSVLTEDTLTAGFANFTVLNGSDTVYGLAQCRGDVDTNTCSACIRNSTQEFIGGTYCPNATDAIIWYEDCQLRYSNTNFFGNLNVDDSGSWYWTSQVDDPTTFYQELDELLGNLTSLATRNPSPPMFATGSKPRNNTQQIIYGLVQCTQDTSLFDCNQCLSSTVSVLQTTLNDSTGGEIVTGSCRVRFDIQLFYNPDTSAPSSLPNSPTPPASLPNSPTPPVSLPNSPTPSPNSASGITGGARSVTWNIPLITFALTYSAWLLMIHPSF